MLILARNAVRCQNQCGEQKVAGEILLRKVVRKLCSPNEDFGNPKNILDQTHATHPLFLDNLHFEHFVAGVNLATRWNYLTKSSKWRLSKKRGWVAYVYFGPPVWALFQGCEYSFWATLTWKCAQKDGPKCFSGFQNLRLGSIKVDDAKITSNATI